MMTEERWKQMEIHANRLRPKGEGLRPFAEVLFLECFDELKERREDEEWCHENAARASFYALSVTLRSNVHDKGINERTLHAAITAAREGK